MGSGEIMSSPSSSSFAPKLSATQKYGNRQSGKYIFVYSKLLFSFLPKKPKCNLLNYEFKKALLPLRPWGLIFYSPLCGVRQVEKAKRDRRERGEGETVGGAFLAVGGPPLSSLGTQHRGNEGKRERGHSWKRPLPDS